MSFPAHLHHAPPITLAYIFVVKDDNDTKETLEDLFINKQVYNYIVYSFYGAGSKNIYNISLHPCAFIHSITTPQVYVN